MTMGGRPASSGSRLWAAAVIVAMSLLALVACGDEEPASQARVVSPGTGDSVTGVTITQVPTPTSTSDPLLASPVYRIEAAGQPQSPLELRIKAQDSRWIVYWDEAVRLWIPVESQRDGAELVAQVDHLSLWSTMVDGIDWLSTGAFRFLGDRALPPECTGTAPSWVTSFDTEPGNHPRLLSCRGGQQDDAILRISNNRGYPLWVTFSNGSTSLSPRSVEVGWPSGFDELVRLGFGTVLGSGRTYLAPGQTLTATFAQPQSPPRTGRVEVHGTLDAPLLAFHMIIEVLSAKDLVDIPVGDGKMLGAKALECYVKLPLGTVGVF